MTQSKTVSLEELQKHPCAKCKIFRKFLTCADRPLACETARAVDDCYLIKIVVGVRKLRNDSELLEKLAKLEHEQWIHWMNYQNKKVGHITDMTIDEWYKQQETWQRWKRLAKTPFNKLTEKEKKSDREWARKALTLFQKRLDAQLGDLEK